MRLTPGRMAVALIVALAASLAAFNVWFRHATTSRIHEHWGTAAMQQIAHAPRAAWRQLSPPTRPGDTAAPPVDGRQPDTLTVDNRTYSARRTGDLIAARGFSNLRHALGQDGSYDWDAADAHPSGDWQWAIVFDAKDTDVADGNHAIEHKTVLLVDLDGRWVRTLQQSKPVPLTAKMAAGLKTFIAERVAEQAAEPRKSKTGPRPAASSNER